MRRDPQGADGSAKGGLWRSGTHCLQQKARLQENGGGDETLLFEADLPHNLAGPPKRPARARDAHQALLAVDLRV